MRVAVLVLGDVGRSPRMQYHAVSLAAMPTCDDVDVIGYGGSKPLEALTSHKHIALHLLKEPATRRFPRSLFLLYAPFKVLYQILQLVWILGFKTQRPDYLLVQIPPAIPTLLVVHLVAAFRGVRLVFDWHNYAYSLMGISLGPRHPLVRLAERIERWFGRGAHANFCVTRAMQEDLATRWRIKAQALHDRPFESFRRTPVREQYELFERLEREIPGALAGRFEGGGGEPALRADRPAIVVSSTSWTPDEDFSLLLHAVRAYDAAEEELPRALFLITGRGPLRERYEREIAGLQLRRCAVHTLWLAPDDYPRLIGSADLGVCLHASSSGLDLPMKVVDMFGCGLPVCARAFACIGELVQDGQNGLLFDSGEQLAGQLRALLAGFPAGAARLRELAAGVEPFQRRRWADAWREVAAPVFDPSTIPRGGWVAWLVAVVAMLPIFLVMIVSMSRHSLRAS
eukprot:tig00000880_g5194.t1